MSKKNDLPVSAVIDDDSIYSMLCLRLIKKCGFFSKTLHFSSAVEALEFMENSPEDKIDVIFLDINMPRMSGFEFLSEASGRLGEAFSSQVVVMVTTSAVLNDIHSAKSFNNVRAYISKPLTENRIRLVLESINDDSGDEFILIEDDKAA